MNKSSSDGMNMIIEGQLELIIDQLSEALQILQWLYSGSVSKSCPCQQIEIKATFTINI